MSVQNAYINDDSSPIELSALGYSGGTDETDSSGVLRHIVITEAGQNQDYDDNGSRVEGRFGGLVLQSVGRGTEIDSVQIHRNGWNPALRIDGGSVNISAVTVSDNESDSIRLGSGYKGNLQDVYVRQQNWGSHKRMAIRVVSEEGAARITTPTIANALIVAGKSRPCQDCGDDPEPSEPFIMSVEGGAGGFFHNMVVTVDPGSDED